MDNLRSSLRKAKFNTGGFYTNLQKFVRIFVVVGTTLGDGIVNGR